MRWEKKYCVLISFIICEFQYFFATGNFSSQNLSADFKRKILFNGFHRILSYSINIHGVIGKTKLLIKENFPKEIYLDPYQIPRTISNLEIKIPQIQFINTETPAYNAQPLYIELYSCSKNGSHNVDVPFHVRYIKPQECDILGETVEIELRPPSVFVTSNDSTCTTGDTEVGSWKTLEHVPVGCKEHFNAVLYLTLLAVGLSTMYIFHVLFRIKV